MIELEACIVTQSRVNRENLLVKEHNIPKTLDRGLLFVNFDAEEI
jgi:hypothetical protein